MHTATRLAAPLIRKARVLNPAARLCAYGLYAPLNKDWLQSLGVTDVLSGEFEEELARLARYVRDGVPSITPDPIGRPPRLQFLVPDRSLLPPLAAYASLRLAGNRLVAGHTEASRGCLHLCRHCPVVPVYNGQFRIVQPEIVLRDIDQQVANGAQHITFGDPDF